MIASVRRSIHRDLLASLEEGMPAHTSLELLEASKINRLLSSFFAICKHFGFTFNIDNPSKLVRENEQKTEIIASKNHGNSGEKEAGKLVLYRKFKKSGLDKKLDNMDADISVVQSDIDRYSETIRWAILHGWSTNLYQNWVRTYTARLQKLQAERNKLAQEGLNRVQQNNIGIIAFGSETEDGRAFLKLLSQARKVAEVFSDRGEFFEKIEALYNYYGEYWMAIEYPAVHRIIWPIFTRKGGRGKKITAAVLANIDSCIGFVLDLERHYRKI